MKVPDWRNLALDAGILPEPTPDDNRIVFWLPGSRDGEFQNWERIGTVARAEIAVEEGLCATAAMSVQARQRVRGFLGKLFWRLQGAAGNQNWMLPNGEVAEQRGERQTDLVLVWAEDDTTPVDETRIQARWPKSKQVRRIGGNLYLVSGVEPPGARNEDGKTAQQVAKNFFSAAGMGPQGTRNAAVPPPPPQDRPREQAEQLLAAARKTGDRRRVATALTDLGMVVLQEGAAKQALTSFQEALALARQLGDRPLESDVLDNLGLAVLAVGQPRQALELFEQELSHARAAGDRFTEKFALHRLGLAYSSLRDLARALAFIEQALAIAHAAGDRKHEIELLWSAAIQHAELGQRDQAIVQAQAAVDLLRIMDNPQAGWFAELLRKYRADETGFGSVDSPAAGPAAALGPFFAGSISTGGVGGPSDPRTAHGQQAGGPGLLRMAFTAVKAMAKFIGSGGKTVTAEIRQKRLQTCAACTHHTGMRCRLCGCFTSAKTWMAHEECPIGKWPA